MTGLDVAFVENAPPLKKVSSIFSALAERVRGSPPSDGGEGEIEELDAGVGLADPGHRVPPHFILNCSGFAIVALSPSPPDTVLMPAQPQTGVQNAFRSLVQIENSLTVPSSSVS
jgi:hypothetical protein